MILENKLNITDPAELAREEEKISKKRAKEMFETGFLNNLEPGTFETLCKIHENMFLEIYELHINFDKWKRLIVDIPNIHFIIKLNINSVK